MVFGRRPKAVFAAEILTRDNVTVSPPVTSLRRPATLGQAPRGRRGSLTRQQPKDRLVAIDYSLWWTSGMSERTVTHMAYV